MSLCWRERSVALQSDRQLYVARGTHTNSDGNLSSLSADTPPPTLQVLSTDIDLLHPPAELEKQKHKTKRLVQSPNSFFMDVKCQGCFQM